MRGTHVSVVTVEAVGGVAGLKQDHVSVIIVELIRISDRARPCRLIAEMRTMSSGSAKRTIFTFANKQRLAGAIRKVGETCF